MYTNFKCPNCGSTSFMYLHSMSTALYSPTYIEDGEIIHHDPNWHTDYYTCTKCHHKLSVQNHEGSEPKVEDLGEVKGYSPYIEMKNEYATLNDISVKKADTEHTKAVLTDKNTTSNPVQERLDRLEKKLDTLIELVQKSLSM